MLKLLIKFMRQTGLLGIEKDCNTPIYKIE